jgi:Stage II sporulation protein E (SpoIIE)
MPPERAPVDRTLRGRAALASWADTLLVHPGRLLAAGLLGELAISWVGSNIDVTRVPGVIGPLAALAATVVAAIDLRVGLVVALAGGVIFTALVSYSPNGGPDPVFFGLPTIMTWVLVALVVGLLTRRWRTQAARSTARAMTLHREFVGSLATPRRSVVDGGVGGLRVVTRYVPGERMLELGGDFLDAVAVEGNVGLLIGDVSGHGAAAAAVGAMLRAAWEGTVAGGVSAERRIAALNDLLLDRAPTDEFFATVCSVLVDTSNHRVRVIAAGHPAPLLLTRDGPQLLDVPVGPPLGMVAGGAPWVSTTLSVPDEFAVLLYTDGIVEGAAAPGDRARLGVDGLLRLCDGLPADERLLDHVLAGAQRANGGALRDDAALLLATHADG